MLRGIFEVHLDVTDLDRSVRFYSEVLGLQIALMRDVDAARADDHSRGARRFALLWVAGEGGAMVGLWERDPDGIRTQHCAFEIGVSDMRTFVAELRGRGIELRDFLQQSTDEPFVFGFIPAASIYLDDPDGHLLELVAPLSGSPRPDLGILPWSQWAAVAE